MTRLLAVLAAAAIIPGVLFPAAVLSAERNPSQRSIPILYPKSDAAVGNRVNLVLDPAADWSSIPFFQVLVGATEHPVVDTSSGRHAYQGLVLARGPNTITVRVLVPAAGAGPAQGKGQERSGFPVMEPGMSGAKQRLAVVSSWTITVYNREGNLAATPARHQPQYFHTRENEGRCSGCHRLDAGAKDRKPDKPQDVLCYACHQGIPSGTHIHGPAAVWSCLACHDPGLAPVRYQFGRTDLWSVKKITQPVEPAVFTLSADALFAPQTATLLADAPAADPAGPKGRTQDGKPGQDADAARQTEVAGRREKQRELFQEILEFAKQNPLDRIRIEVHSSGDLRSAQQITDARAQAVAKLLRTYGITDPGRVTAAGMGNSLPKATGPGKEVQALNDRVEVIVAPPSITVRNSLSLPVIPDRERVVLDLAYAGGPSLRDLRITERLPRGTQYIKGSAYVGGRPKDPMIRGDELAWQLGDRGANVQEAISYVVKKEKGGPLSVNTVLQLTFTANRKAETRTYDPARPERDDHAVQAVCTRCHADLLEGTFKHGPAEAGYCTLCHDPHASDFPAWTRDQDWHLCTTCHAEKRTDVHMIMGFVRGNSHPTEKVPDPSRPGKRLSCVSCHAPHSSSMKELLRFEARSKFETCKYCHRGK